MVIPFILFMNYLLFILQVNMTTELIDMNMLLCLYNKKVNKSKIDTCKLIFFKNV